MFFIGDVHGEFEKYEKLILGKSEATNFKPMNCSIQLGDMGIGFGKDHKFPKISKKHMFIRGNHDNPEICKKHKNHLGDYGYIKELDIFYVAGGYSIDWAQRTLGFSWWMDEELSYQQLQKAFDLYKKEKPRIFISHEAPANVKTFLISSFLNGDSSTQVLLQQMWEYNKPEIWIVGHWHMKKIFDFEGTKFVVLDELINGKDEDCIFELPDINW